MRYQAPEWRVDTVTLDGVDLTMDADWADPETGEVGMLARDADGMFYQDPDNPTRLKREIRRGVVVVTGARRLVDAIDG